MLPADGEQPPRLMRDVRAVKKYLAERQVLWYINSMLTVQEIEKAVAHLPRPDLDKFRAWFDTFDADAWDKQFEEDVQSGKLDRLADQALGDLNRGRCTER